MCTLVLVAMLTLSRVQMLVCVPVCINGCGCVYVRSSCVCSCVHVYMWATVCDEVFACVCVCAGLSSRASVCVRVCEYLRGSRFVGVQLSVCVCMHVHSRASDHANSVSCANVCVYAGMYQRLWMCVCAQFLCVLMCACVYVGNRV